MNIAGDYTLDKKWSTPKAEYSQFVNKKGLKLVVATTKTTGSQHLLLPDEVEETE